MKLFLAMNATWLLVSLGILAIGDRYVKRAMGGWNDLRIQHMDALQRLENVTAQRDEALVLARGLTVSLNNSTDQLNRDAAQMQRAAANLKRLTAACGGAR